MRTMIPVCTLSLLWGSAALFAVTLGDQGDSCDPPPRLDFAELADEYKEKNSFPVGSTVKYTCRPGYIRSKQKISRKCLQNQKWSEIEEFCTKKSCGNPREPDNGRMHVSGDFLFGATVTYTCDEGHRLIGHSSRRCIILGKKVEWTGDIPFCQRIPCFPPPVIPNGKHTGRNMEDFFYGSVVTYTCDKGYLLVGNASIHCTTEDGLNGVWSGRAYCGEIHCPPPQVENGRIVTGKSDTYAYSQRVTIDCSVGHKIYGSREIHCQVDGTWDPPPPTCEPVPGCAVPQIRNGRITTVQVEVKPTDRITFECDPGYILKGKHTIQCQYDNTWDTPVPICVRSGDSCVPPPRLDFAELSDEYKEKNSFPVGSTVKYTCRPGYTRSQLKTSRACLQNQKWSEVEEFCTRRSCGNPGEPENGRLLLSGDFLFGSTINYSCEEGYKLIGESSRRCEISDRKVAWTGSIPLCQSISCLPPPDIPNGMHSGRYSDNFFYGSAVTYTCDKDYPLIGNASIYCTTKDGINGVWSGRAYCGVISCPSPQIENGRVETGYSGTYTYNQRVTLGCNAGHKLAGSREIYCQMDGKWDPPLPHCEQVSRCPFPPDIANGKHNGLAGKMFSSQMSVTYSCDPGYSLIGKASISCTASGTWSLPLPRCEAKCSRPQMIANGKYSSQESESFTNGMFVEYSCEPGYNLIGNARIFCTEFGAWNSSAPNCKFIGCIIPEIQNGRITTYEMVVKPTGTITFECYPGYILKGNQTIECKSDSMWDPPVPVCVKEVQCLPPPNIQNGTYSDLEVSSFTSGRSVRYTCEPGYTLIGKAVIYCMDSGRWNPPAPYCEVMHCSVPPRIAHGKYIGEDFTYRKSVIYICDGGYSLIGEHVVTCHLQGSNSVNWTEPPKCKGCLLPPEIANGKHDKDTGVLNNFPHGSSVTYLCDPGYFLSGSATIYCLSSGMWDQPVPQCKSRQRTGCITPEIQNARIARLNDVDEPMELITFQCDPGYILKGNHTIRCHSDSTWDSPAPSCVREVQCQLPPQVQNGAHNKQEVAVFTSGMSVKYTCNPGYTLTGEATIYCTDSGTWSFPTPLCAVVQCPLPPYVQNGAHSSQGTAIFTIGISVKYTCEPGYTLIGEATINCTDSGTWSFPAPHCEVMQCQLPPRIVHGTYTGEDFTYGKSVIYICHAGYSLIGEHVVTCNLQDSHSVNWTEPPKCKGCLTPPQIANGRSDTEILGDNFPYGSWVTYHCDPGYILTGSATIHCLSSGTWDQPVPQCKGRQVSNCVNPEIQNGKITRSKAKEKATGSITIECNPGYILKGNHTIQCTSDRTWDSPVPICVKEVQCQQPPHVQNGIHSQHEMRVFTSGMSVEYTCNPGYILTGEATIYCTDSGTWSFPTPHCKEVQCPLPPVVENGIFSNQKTAVFTSGMFVKYSCEPGYTLIGEATIYCTNSGTWSPPAPYCGVTHCPLPPRIAHGKYIGEDFTYGKTVIYICDAGYSLIGDHEVTCILEDSNALNWTEPPKCKGCVAPPEIVNGKRDTEIKDFPYGSSVTYRCDPGYFLTGAETIHCLSTGTWDRPVPHCKGRQLVECSLPPNVQHGKYNASESAKYTSGKFIKYICNPGYVLKGEAMIYCTASGKWSLPIPYCEEIRCQQPPHIQNGTYSNLEAEEFSSGMSVRYTCEAGYTLTGEATIYCTESGSWNPPAPRCEVLQCPSPPSVPNGDHNGHGSAKFAVGGYMNYTCHQGYLLRGKDFIYCTTSGEWSQPLPQCEVMHCPLPPRIAHGKYIGENFVYGKSVIYICDAGYSLVGHRVVTCILEGSNSVNWTEPPKCKGCLAPPEIANGKHHNDSGILKDFPYGSSVTYHCDPDYFLIGTATIYCLSSGIWDQPVPQCKDRQSVGCTLPQVSGGKKITTETVIEVGDNVTLECEEGYILNGSPHLQCQQGFMWDPPVPVCKSASYFSTAIGFGSLVGVLLLVISGGVWMMVSKQNKVKYTPGKRKIYTGPDTQIQEQSNIPV